MLEYICKSSLSTISNGICIKICTDVMAMQNSPPQERVRLFHCLGLLVGKLLLLHAPLLKHLQSVLHVLHVCPVHPYGGFRLLILFFFPYNSSNCSRSASLSTSDTLSSLQGLRKINPDIKIVKLYTDFCWVIYTYRR